MTQTNRLNNIDRKKIKVLKNSNNISYKLYDGSFELEDTSISTNLRKGDIIIRDLWVKQKKAQKEYIHSDLGKIEDVTSAGVVVTWKNYANSKLQRTEAIPIDNLEAGKISVGSKVLGAYFELWKGKKIQKN